MDDEMELMNSWMKDVRGFDDMSISHWNLLSLQIRMVNDEWLAVLDVHVTANYGSCFRLVSAGKHSTFRFDGS